MSIKHLMDLSSNWGIEISNSAKLSERATLITSNNGERYVLKQKESVEKAINEIKLLLRIDKQDFKVHLPIKTNGGEYYYCSDDVVYCIYNYLDGQTFKAIDTVKNTSIPELLGSSIAQLHQVLKQVSNDLQFPKKNLYNQVFDWAVQEILNNEENPDLKSIYHTLQVDFKNVIHDLPQQLIHRDAHIFNVIIQKDRLAGFVDFDIVEHNVRLFDICYCSTSVLNEIFSDEALREKWFDFIKNLFASYHTVNPLNEVERKSVALVMLSIQTIFMAFFMNIPTLFNANKKMFLWLYENKERILKHSTQMVE
ncbi:phosphotransferase enzyme family protein [Cytobacillus sp. Hm23]